MNYVKYILNIEVKQFNEDEQIDKIVEMMYVVNVKVFDKYCYGICDVYVKQYGMVVGMLEIFELFEYFVQGLFVKFGSYLVVIWFFSVFGEFKDDSVLVLYGMVVKVIGVFGKKILFDKQDEVMQDFLMVIMLVIFFGDVEQYLKMQNVVVL